MCDKTKQEQISLLDCLALKVSEVFPPGGADRGVGGVLGNQDFSLLSISDHRTIYPLMTLTMEFNLDFEFQLKQQLFWQMLGLYDQKQ